MSLSVILDDGIRRQERLDRLQAIVEARFTQDWVPPDTQMRYSLPPCRTGCGRVARTPGLLLCQPHEEELKRAAQPFDVWIRCADERKLDFNGPFDKAAVRGVFVLAPLSGQIRLEMGYALQIRGSLIARGPIRAHAFNHVVERLAAQGTQSLLELPEARQGLIETLGITTSQGYANTLLRATVTGLRALFGLPGRRSLGPRTEGSAYFIDTTLIDQPWLRALMDRWSAYRLAAELDGAQSMGAKVVAIQRFSSFAIERDAVRPEDMTRDLLVDYLAHLRTLRREDGEPFSAVSVHRWASAVNQLFEESRTHGWEPRLPSNARYLKGEMPRRKPSEPRFLSEYVMQQLETCHALDQIEKPEIRTSMLILMTTGMRIKHVLELALDCLDATPREGGMAFSLNYIDTKTRKAMRVPIRDDVAAAVQAQQQRVRDRPGIPSDILFPGDRLIGGRWVSMSRNKFRRAMDAWLAGLNLTDENGKRVMVTPHQFRHTCGTRWINSNVPHRVVMKLLGHKSPSMVDVYAQLHDSTVRDAWEQAQRVNLLGQPIAAAGDDPDTEWLLENLSRATQALPNGYCALPIQQSCPHANACLTCDSFTTGPEFLPVLREQRERHEQLMTAAESRGQLRLVEINRAPLTNLCNMIAGIEAMTEPVAEEQSA